MQQWIHNKLDTPLLRWLLGNELVRRIIKNSSYLFSATGISAALSMLQGILAARLLGVAEFGVLGAITTFASVVNNFVSFRMSELVIKYVGHYTENNDHQRAAAVFKASALTEMLASCIAFSLVWALAPIGARYFAKDPSTTSLFTLYGAILLANLIAESSTGLLQIFDRFRGMAVWNAAQSFFTLAITAIACLTNGGLLEIVIAYLIGKTVSALGLTVIALVEASRRWGVDWWRSPLSLLRPQAGELARFAISTNISATLSLFNKDSELLWVALFRSQAETGYYRLALSLTNLVQMPVNLMPQTTYPELSREVARSNWNNVRYVLKRGSVIIGAYSLVATLVLALLGKPLIRYIYTPEYLPAYPALIILLIGFLVANTFYWRRITLLSLGYPNFPVKVNSVLTVLKVLGVCLLVPKFGYLASAALLTGFYWAGSLISVLKIRSVLAKVETPATIQNATTHE